VIGCGSCTFHVQGECRRYPPKREVLKYLDRDGFQTGSEVLNLQPGTPDDYWCGEFKQQYRYVVREEPKRRPDTLA
jgi:hypothetical protein